MLTDFLGARKTWIFSKAEGSNTPVGKLVDFVINVDSGIFEALWVNTAHGLKLLSRNDILRWSREKIMIASVGDFSDPDQLPKLQKIIDREVPIIGTNVFSVFTTIQDLAQKKMGTATLIGRVTNFSFDTLSPRIITIIVHSGALWWAKRRIIPRTRILKVTPEGIFVSENKILVDEGSTETEKAGIPDTE